MANLLKQAAQGGKGAPADRESNEYGRLCQQALTYGRQTKYQENGQIHALAAKGFRLALRLSAGLFRSSDGKTGCG